MTKFGAGCPSNFERKHAILPNFVPFPGVSGKRVLGPQAQDPRQDRMVELRDAIRDAPEADDAEQARRVAQFFIS